MPSNPARPATGFAAFHGGYTHRHLATGLNLPYELLLKDFSKIQLQQRPRPCWRRGGTPQQAGLGADYWAQPIYERRGSR